MVEKYPKEQQNPPYEPGQRPADQPPPKQRVPDDYHQPEPDPRGITDENIEGRDESSRQERMGH